MAPSSRRHPNRAADPSRAAVGLPRWWWSGPVVGGLLAGMLLAGYLVLFYRTEPLHWQGLTMALLPDQLVLQWVGGSWRRAGLLDRLPVLLAAAAILTMATLVGRQSLRWLRCDERLTQLEQLALGCGLGLSGLSTWTLAAGLAGQLSRSWLVVLPPAIIAAWSAANEYRLWRQTPKPADDVAVTGWLERRGWWLAAPLVLLITLGSVVPPWEFDVREYHLQVPKEWYQQGRIGFLPHNVYGNMPLGAEMQALLAMVLWPSSDGWWWGALVGKAVIGSYATLTAVTLYAMGRRWFGGAAGTAAAVLYLAVPWVAQVSMAGLIDAVVGLYVLQAIHVALIWSSAGGDARRPWQLAALCGLLAGSAAACKYPALVFAVLPLAGWILLGPRVTGPFATGTADSGSGRSVLRHLEFRALAVFGLAVLLSCGLWLGKNWILTGNPTYPLLASVFDSETRTPQRIQQWRQAHQVPADAQGRKYTVAQLLASLRQVGWSSPWLGPLLVPLVAMSLRRRSNRRLVAALLLWLAYCLAVWWLATHRIDRFLVPMLPVAALLAGAGATWAEGRLARGVIVVGLAASVIACGLIISSRLFPADNRFLVAYDQLRPDLPTDRDPHFYFSDPAHVWLNSNVPAGKRVLLVGDAQPFDLDVPALYATCFDECPLQRVLGGARSADERREALRAAGISHVYVKWSEIDRYRSSGNYGFGEFVTRPLVRDELVARQRVLRPVPVGLDPELGQVFAVSDPP